MKNRTLPDKLIIFLLSLSIILKPVYLWKSGIPQIADILLMFSFILFYITFGLKTHPQMNKLINIQIIFIYYILLANLCWELILNGGLSVLRISAYYIYNFFVCLFAMMLHHKYNKRLFHLVYNAVFLSVILQMATFMLQGGFTGHRSVAYFNNPNQLGYHSLLCTALMLFLSQRTAVRKITLILGLFFTGILVMASLSKAAIIPYFVMLLYYILIYKKKNRCIVRIMFFIVVAFFLLSLLLLPDLYILKPGTLLYSVNHRISLIGTDTDDSLAGRGYTRLLDYLAYLPVGIGEGAYYRFEPPGEFHSTLGNLLLSYGIIGLGCFLMMLYIVLKKNNYQELYLFLCILLYGLTHNGIRNPFLWMLLGLVYADSICRSDEPSKLPITADALGGE